MEKIDAMIHELEDTIAKEKHARVYFRIKEVMGVKMANLVLTLAEGVRATDCSTSMRDNVESGDEFMLTAEKSLAVFQWLRAGVIPVLAEL